MLELLINLNQVTPDAFYPTVFDIPFETLKTKGIKTIFIDLDNTLISYQETNPTTEIVRLFQTIEQLGFQLIIVSNNRGSRVGFFSKQVGLDSIANAKKPTQIGFRKAEKQLGIHHPNEVCLIGDQVMTDVLGGKRRGYWVILVNPIDRLTEKWFTKMNRIWEKRVLNRLKRVKPNTYEALQLHEKR